MNREPAANTRSDTITRRESSAGFSVTDQSESSIPDHSGMNSHRFPACVVVAQYSVRKWSKWAVFSPAVRRNAGLCCRSPAVWSRLSWAVQVSGTGSSVTSPPANRSRYTEESPAVQIGYKIGFSFLFQ